MPDKVADSAPAPKSSLADAAGLAEALRSRIRGRSHDGSHDRSNEDVRFDPGARALYATDGSNYRQVPIGVVLPHDADDVLATIELCREFGAPLLCRGGGTSLSGQCCNVAVVLDFSKYMSRIIEIDPARRIARVEPGVVLDHLRNAAEKHHLTFAPDPASHASCTIGGMIGNNSCGVHSVMAGKTDDNIEQLEVVTYDGVRMTVGQNFIRGKEESCGDSRPRLSGGPEVSGRGALRVHQIHDALKQIAETYAALIRQKFPNIPRRVSGYNLNCSPKTDSISPAPWSAPKEPARQSLKPPVAWSKALRKESYSSSPTLTFFNAPTTSPKSWRTNPSASKASTTSSSTTPGPKARIPRALPCSPKAEAGSWSSSAARLFKKPNRRPTL
jgi:FAD binding domain